MCRNSRRRTPKPWMNSLRPSNFFIMTWGLRLVLKTLEAYRSNRLLTKWQFFPFFQVTEGKQDLEKALSLSQKFQKESTMLQDWLITSEAQLQQKNSCGDMPADIDAEIAWTNVSLLSKPFIPVNCRRKLLPFLASWWSSGTVPENSTAYLVYLLDPV